MTTPFFPLSRLRERAGVRGRHAAPPPVAGQAVAAGRSSQRHLALKTGVPSFVAAALRIAVVVMLSGPAWAVSDPVEMLPDRAQEARAEAIGRQLRCLVCQNESIEDSNADLARDLRRMVRTRVAAGDTDEAATSAIVSRYGDFVRLRPPVNALTAVLWASPVLALSLGLGFALWSRRRPVPAAAPLSDAERTRLAALTKP